MLFLVLRGGDDGDDQTVGGRATATPTATATPRPPPSAPQVADDIPLAAARRGGDAQGVMTVYLQDGALQFAIQAVGPARRGSNPYVAVWLQKGDKYRRLGFANAAEDGTLAAGGPSEDLAASSRSSTRPTTGSSSRRRPRTRPRADARRPHRAAAGSGCARAAASRGS